MVKYFPYDPLSFERISETLTVEDGHVMLRHIPKKNSVDIDGFSETDSLSLTLNQFRVEYSLETFYRESTRVIHFNEALNGSSLSISYIAVGTPITADDMNEIKAHLDSAADPAPAPGSFLSEMVLDTVPSVKEGGLWYSLQGTKPVIYLRHDGLACPVFTYNPSVAAQSASFTGINTVYATVPLAALQGASEFTLEFKIATTDDLTPAASDNQAVGCRALFGCNKAYHRFAFGLRGGFLCAWKANNLLNKYALTAQEGFIADGLVHCVALSNSEAGMALFADGQLVAQTNEAHAVINDSNCCFIGWDGTQNSLLQFELFEARLWSKSRSADDIFSGKGFAPVTDSQALRAHYIPSGADSLPDLSQFGFDAPFTALSIKG